MIHILQHADCEGPAYLATMLQQRGLEYKVLRPDRGELPQLADSDALIILGGPQSVNNFRSFPWMRREIEFVRLAIDSGLPVLGICLGAQVLASACGMQVVACPAKEIGWHMVQCNATDDAVGYFRDVPQEFNCFHWHGEMIVPHGDIPVLAATDITPCQAMAPQPGLLALQFHLEVTRDAILSMAAAFHGELADELISLESLLGELDEQLPQSQQLAELVIGKWLAQLGAGRQLEDAQ